MLKRVFRWTIIVLSALLLVGFAATWQQQYARHADASPLAIAAAASDDSVIVASGRFLTFRPRNGDERLGVVLYPGAYVDVRGYAPVLRRVAAAGYRVIVAPMPFELAILSIDRLLDARSQNADLQHWVLAGHSLGGAAAATFAAQHREALDGLIIWDSYPPSFASLADFEKPVWHIHRATRDGAPPDTFVQERYLFPHDSRWVPIPGGIHMNFGSFIGGGYKEDWAPDISQAAQHDLVVAAMLQALADIERHGQPVAAK